MALGEAVKGTHIPWASVEDDTLQSIRTELLNTSSYFRRTMISFCTGP